MKKKQPTSDGIPLKKYHGQYFLRDKHTVFDMLSAVTVQNRSVFEIGCGDGFLTREILAQKPEKFWVFEIDPAWAEKVGRECVAPNFKIYCGNFLDEDLSILEPHAPWIVLSNLPYHVTFPILHRLYVYRACISEGVLMMQEEVAQKIVKTGGRGYGYISLFFQYYFEWKLLSKVVPSAFYPVPKVFSRLLHFKVKKNVEPIVQEQDFWYFIKFCFAHPRRTLRNNLLQTHIDLSHIPEKFLGLRAQQMSISDFLTLWPDVRKLFIKIGKS